MRPFSFALLTLTAGILVSCGGGEAPPGPPSSVASLSTGTLSGTVGTALTDPIAVRVTDANGRNVPGVEVTFSVPLGSGSLSAVGTASTSFGVSPQFSGTAAFTLVDSTDANGEAAAIWTLGTVAGAQSASASVTGLGSVSFSAGAVAGPPATAAIHASAGFIGFTSDSLDGSLAVIVVDEYHNPVSDEAVTWSVVSGGGAVAVTSSTTDASGIARAGAMLGATAGLNLFTGTVAGFPPDTIDAVGVEPVTDPRGDAFSAGAGLAAHDVVRYGMADVDGLGVVYFRYDGTVAPTPTSGAPPPNAVFAEIDLDLDQDSTTGGPPLVACGGFPLGFGSDAWIDLYPLSSILDVIPDAPDGYFAGFQIVSFTYTTDPCVDGEFSGYAFLIAPLYGARSLTGLFDFANLADDGTFDFTSVHFNGASATVTDVVPDSLAHTFQLLPPTLPSGLPSADSQRLAERLKGKLSSGVLDVRRRVVLRRDPLRVPGRR